MNVSMDVSSREQKIEDLLKDIQRKEVSMDMSSLKQTAEDLLKGSLGEEVKREIAARHPERQKLTISLSQTSLEYLKLLSELQSTTMPETLEKALATEAYIQNEIGKGSKIFLKHQNGETFELIFRK